MRLTSLGAGVALLAALALAPTASATSTATVSGATLTVTGSSGADQITVTLPGGDGITPDPLTGVPTPPPDPLTTPYQVDDPAGVTAQTGCTQVGTTRAECGRGGLVFGGFTVRVNAAGGADYIQTFMPNQALGDLAFLSGGAGNDAIFGSENEEVISGDGGNDLMDGGAGGDFMSGGTLNSHVPSFEGGVSQPATYSPGPGAGQDRIYGGGFDDQLTDGDNDTGTAAPQPNTATAQLNSDVVDGGVCAAEPLPTGVPAPTGVVICPVLDANVDNPEDHDAIMLAHRTRPLTIDVLVLTASQGAAGENESIRRIEAVWAGAGNDKLYGRDGDFGDDSLRGNGGNDHLEARGGDDELLGGDGQDRLLGGAGADVINPGSKLVSQTLTATVTTADGPDVIDGGTNSTIIGGHSQSDLVTYEGRSEPIRIDMNQPGTVGGPGENDSFTGVEDIMGGHREDVIVGDAIHNLISGDPQPPVVNVPPDPPLPPGPPGGHFGNDHITTRDAGPDTVDCTGGAADVHVADRLDASINCETVDRPAPPPPAPPLAVAQRIDASEGVIIGGPTSAGRVKVGRDGAVRLARNVITCPETGGPCAVTTAVTARIRTAVAWGAASANGKATLQTLRLGSAAYEIKGPVSAAGGFHRATVRSRLSRRALRLLERRRAIRSTVRVSVAWEGTTTTRRIRVILKPVASARRR